MTGMSPRAKSLALALLAMTQFVIVIDASIVNIALPSIGRALKFSQTDLSWVVNAYTLTFGGFLLLGGRLADLMGRRRMFIVGLLLFSGASLVGGLALAMGVGGTRDRAAKLVNTDRDKASASISKFTKQPIELVKATVPNRSEPALKAEQLAWWIEIMSSQKMLQTKVDLNKLMLN